MADLARLRPQWQPILLSVVRIMVGLLFLEHGLAKVAGFPLQPNHGPFQLLTLNPGAQGLIELVGGFLLALGLFTRPVAFILAGDMAAAYFVAHAPRGFFPLLNGGELAIVYCFTFLYFSTAGAGAWSLDRLRVPATRPMLGEARWEEERLAAPWSVRRVPAAGAAAERQAAPGDPAVAEEESRRR